MAEFKLGYKPYPKNLAKYCWHSIRKEYRKIWSIFIWIFIITRLWC